MTENEIRRLLKLIPENSGFKFYPVENFVYPSFPDVYFAGKDDFCGLIEIKILKGKNEKNLSVKYQPGQQNFLEDHFKINKNVFLLLWYPDTYYLTQKFTVKHDITDVSLYLPFKSTFQIVSCLQILWRL